MSYVYFIVPEALFFRKDHQLVKIGYTKHDPTSRLQALQCGSPVFLDVHAYIDGSVALERAFHDAFADMRSHGEWFFLTGKLFDLMGYFDNSPRGPKYVSQDRVIAAMHDVVFATSSSHPSMTDEEYNQYCDPAHLMPWFPEALNL